MHSPTTHIPTAPLSAPYIKKKTWLHQGPGKQPAPSLGTFERTAPHLHVWMRSHNWRSLADSEHPQTSWGCHTGGCLCTKEGLKIRLRSEREPLPSPPSTLSEGQSCVEQEEAQGGTWSSGHNPSHPRSPVWRKEASQKRGVGPGVRIWRVSLAHRWLVHQCPLLSADGFQCLLAIEAW